MDNTCQSSASSEKTDSSSDFDEVAALKAQFRREDEDLRRQGRGAEIIARNRELLGIPEGARGKLVGFGGRFFS